jgi:molecular chaperone DnaK
MAYETEKQLEDMGDKIDADSKAKVEAAVGRVRDALTKDDTEEIKSATEALTQTWHEAASKIYASTAGAQGAGGGQDAQTEDKSDKKKDKDGAVDADFEVVD